MHVPQPERCLAVSENMETLPSAVELVRSRMLKFVSQVLIRNHTENGSNCWEGTK